MITTTLRVRYSETDQMGTFYNSRALEWFEVARTEWLRATGTSYAAMEHMGIGLPLVEAHVEYLGRARYDDKLLVTASAEMTGKARLRFDVSISHDDDSGDVCRGYTVHAAVNGDGRPIRPPAWFLDAIDRCPTA
ncbi:MAG: acyl-CoA thioesterase [Planctomycetes bacterium]|nr:acyl-CoA thioesterase [Planctomycetota bacterium]